jgi:hypothetical protein
MKDLRNFPPIAQALRKHVHPIVPPDPQPFVYHTYECCVDFDSDTTLLRLYERWHMTLEGSTRCAMCGYSKQLRNMRVAYNHAHRMQMVEQGLLCKMCSYQVRSTSRKTITVRQLENTLGTPPDLDKYPVEFDWKRDLQFLRQIIVDCSKYGTLIDIQAITSKIARIFQRKRMFHEWKTLMIRKRIQKRCSVISQELMEVVWHPQRIQRFGWDVDKM